MSHTPSSKLKQRLVLYAGSRPLNCCGSLFVFSVKIGLVRDVGRIKNENVIVVCQSKENDDQIFVRKTITSLDEMAEAVQMIVGRLREITNMTVCLFVCLLLLLISW